MNATISAILLLSAAPCVFGARIVPDVSAVKPGPITVAAAEDSLTVRWNDAAAHRWEAVFSLDSSKPLITAIAVDGRKVVDRANPAYRCSTGKRRGGWDAFFDFPPGAPEGREAFFRSFIRPRQLRAQLGIGWKFRSTE